MIGRAREDILPSVEEEEPSIKEVVDSVREADGAAGGDEGIVDFICA